MGQTFDPNIKVDQLPTMSYMRRCRRILMIVAKVCSILLAAREEKWHQICTDATSVGNVAFQYVVLSISENEIFRPIVLTATTILENGETAQATCDTITLAIIDSGTYLKGVSTVKDHYFPDGTYCIPDELAMSMSKLMGAHFTSDTCNAAKDTITKLHQVAIQAGETARKDDIQMSREWQLPLVQLPAPPSFPLERLPPFTPLLPLVTYVARCWNHLKNVGCGTMTKGCTTFFEGQTPRRVENDC